MDARFRLAAVALALGAVTLDCGGNSRSVAVDGTSVSASAITIERYGSIQAIIDHGATQGLISLRQVPHTPDLVGLGWLSGLRGEITILEGETWVAYANYDGTSRAELLGDKDEPAAFLVTARVPHWQVLPVLEDIRFDDLADALEKLVRDAGLDPNQPFPFVIEGALSELNFSVVDGRAFPRGNPIARDALRVTGAKVHRASTTGTLVGFYSAHDDTFLAPGQHVRLHVLLRSEHLMGHVDHVDLPSGVSLRAPAASGSQG